MDGGCIERLSGFAALRVSQLRHAHPDRTTPSRHLRIIEQADYFLMSIIRAYDLVAKVDIHNAAAIFALVSRHEASFGELERAAMSLCSKSRDVWELKRLGGRGRGSSLGCIGGRVQI